MTAVMDWHNRYVLSWELSITMDKDFCISSLERALRCHGTPYIFNTDQGSQYTSHEFTKVLKDKEIKISMDGKGRCMDNIFIERLWRSVKYEKTVLTLGSTIFSKLENEALPAASGRGIRLKYCAPRGGVLTQATQ